MLILGLDVEEGPEPFEFVKRFVHLAPRALPAYSLLTAFGRVAPLNLEYQKAGRLLPFPFHFMNNNHVMNVRPKDYSWPEFFDVLMARDRPGSKRSPSCDRRRKARRRSAIAEC